MRSKRVVWAVVGAIAVVVIAAGTVLAVRVFGGDAPAEVALSSPSASPSSGTSGTSDGSADGAWIVDTSSGSIDDATATFAGYRIREELGSIGANTAVGRTGDVSGTMVVDGTSIASLNVEVDMTTLASDDPRRDLQLAERGLETAAFPTATFELTEPISFDAAPAQNETVNAEATGELTVHGVTRDVTVPVEARWDGDRVEVVASFDVALADYEIEPPTGFLVLSVADTGTVELHLVFTRA